jgi:ketol-acid reductoisomerase
LDISVPLELYLSGEMARTWQSFAEEGFFKAVRLHGHSATFGGFARLGDIDSDGMKRLFAATLDDITSGGFADRFQGELAAGSPSRELIEAMIAGDDPLSKVEAIIRDAKGG